MAYVGIDQSYSGFAIVILHDVGGGEFKADEHLAKFDPKKHGGGVDRLLVIEYWLAACLAGWDVDHVCMEGYAPGSKFGREVAGELGYAVKRALRMHPQRLYPTIVPPSNLKKFVTGKGNVKKNEMLLGVYKRWGAEFTDDNLADAYSLAQAAKAIDTGFSDLNITQFQKDALSGLLTHTEMRR